MFNITICIHLRQVSYTFKKSVSAKEHSGEPSTYTDAYMYFVTELNSTYFL